MAKHVFFFAAMLGACASAGQVTVQPGDTLFQIAKRTGLSVAALKAANHLASDTIQVGQTLMVPSAAPVAPTTAPASSDTEVRLIYRRVQVGPRDTLGDLANTYRVTPEQLAQLNGLSQSQRQLATGQKLLVPQRIPVPRPPHPSGPPAALKTLAPLNIPVQLVRVDLRHKDVLVAPVLPPQGLRSGATIHTLAQTSGARAVVNGGYFHPRSFVPAGDLVMQGRLVSWGRIPAALAITPDNRATIRASALPMLGQPLSRSWAGMETVIATGPRLLTGGKMVTRYSAVFKDPAVFRRAARTAVGLVGNRDLVFLSTRQQVTVTEMAKIAARLGLQEALLLDGGSSTGLAWDGKVLTSNSRKIAYGIGVFTGYTGRRYTR